MTTIDVTGALEGKPRPHYLTGEADYERKGDSTILLATAYFPSSVPSIGDRMLHPVPHVNIGDAYFALWNAVHIIGDMDGFHGPLTHEDSYRARRPIPADTPISLRTVIIKKPSDKRGRFEGIYELSDEELLRLWGTGIAMGRA